MLAAGRRWVSLGRAAKLLGVSYRTLVRHLEDEKASGFQIHSRWSLNGKRLRYLALDEIQRAMGRIPEVPPKGDFGKPRGEAKP